MKIQSAMEQKLERGLDVRHLEVVNESSQHNVPPGSESHFKVVVVSPQFDGQSLVQRHRLVYDLLAEEMSGGVHALALHTYTEADWQRQNTNAPDSPKCRGGKARES
ncbi:MAG: BolA family protein [Gammaproteobacteria bacterium]